MTRYARRPWAPEGKQYNEGDIIPQSLLDTMDEEGIAQHTRGEGEPEHVPSKKRDALSTTDLDESPHEEDIGDEDGDDVMKIEVEVEPEAGASKPPHTSKTENNPKHVPPARHGKDKEGKETKDVGLTSEDIK